ncbi:MAG: IclR family transcriptional regulator [Rhodovulum sulfidophilum]|uniref:IclR family transcriptional regulator n=1 Tax=Rhodovulum sulfidophilum TaxID=35806 RepID=A0A2W5NMX4_RHOSU|nr:MAG: IclR family transcriptional regulator [Rhodovulum sulfidophilum]
MDLSDDIGAADRYRAPALDKGLDILEVLATQPRGLTRAEIVKELGLGPSQIYRMLERLVARGYVARIEGDRYALTLKLFLLGTRHPPVRRLVAQAQPLLDDFALETRRSCHLVLPDHGKGVIVAQASPYSHWEFRARVGAELDLFATGSGLTLLAFQAPERRAETLGQWGIAEAEARLARVAEELARIRARGYRVGPSRHVLGVTDLSAPVLGPDGDAAAAVTCAYVVHPDETGESGADLEGRERALDRLRSVARALSYG